MLFHVHLKELSLAESGGILVSLKVVKDLGRVLLYLTLNSCPNLGLVSLDRSLEFSELLVNRFLIICIFILLIDSIQKVLTLLTEIDSSLSWNQIEVLRDEPCSLLVGCLLL